MKNEVIKLNVSIGISLLDRSEADKLKGKLEKLHPMIPNAKMTSEDNGPLNL